MKELRSKVLHAAAGLIILFLPLAAIMDPIDLYILTGSAGIVTSLAAVHAYWPALRYAVSRSFSDLDKTDILSMSIILVFLSMAARDSYVSSFMGFMPLPIGRPEEYFLPLSFLRYTSVIAALMALSARDDIIGPRYLQRVPGWPRAIISLVIGVIVGVIIILSRH